MTIFRNPRTLRVAARQLAEAMHSDCCPADRAFDQFLPERLSVVSPFYWSPLAVAQRAAEWFTDAGVHTVVDIGSGAGKFCVAAALFGGCRFMGLEQRPFLVQSARALAHLFDMNDRVRFVDGALGTVRLRSPRRTISSIPLVTIRSASNASPIWATNAVRRAERTMSRLPNSCFGVPPSERGFSRSTGSAGESLKATTLLGLTGNCRRRCGCGRRRDGALRTDRARTV